MQLGAVRWSKLMDFMEFLSSFLPGGFGKFLLIGLAILFVVAINWMFRTVVTTNTVHIVQRKGSTTSYGTGQKAGNVYMAWPSWLPMIGVSVIQLPVSNFDLTLMKYEAYDKDRVPFHVDVTAFFRIKDTGLAAQRIVDKRGLDEQLMQIVQGAVRKVLASDTIHQIMLERAKFGDMFTNEVESQVAEWGVEPVKNMELMDIRDTPNSQVIANIMAMKTSQIEMESRKAVAQNQQAAETAEIEAQQAVDVRKQEAEQAVGQRTATKVQAVGVSNQEAQQKILEAERETTERSMQVKRVTEIRTAEIERDKGVVTADQDKQVQVITAEGHLEAQRREAQGIEAIGQAKATAEKLMQLAPVEAQIVLAKEIGANTNYQQYLLGIEAIKIHGIVGSKQAEALQQADVKVIANSGNALDGAGNAMGLFSAKSGTDLAAFVEAAAQSPIAQTIIAKMKGKESNEKSAMNGSGNDSK